MAHSDTFPILKSLRRAADGLLMPSETDATFEPFFWPNADVSDLTPARVAELAGAAKDDKIETVSLRSFSRDATNRLKAAEIDDSAKRRKPAE